MTRNQGSVRECGDPCNSITVQLAKPAGCSQHPLDSFELVEPVLKNAGGDVIGAGQSRRAGNAVQSVDRLPISGQGFIAVSPAKLAIFAEKDNCGNPGPPAGAERGCQFGIVVAIGIAHLDLRAGRSEMFEHRTLVHAVSAPRSRHDQHFHLPLEVPQQVLLFVRQMDRIMKFLPAPLLLSGSISRQKFLIRKCGFECGGEIHGGHGMDRFRRRGLGKAIKLPRKRF